MRTAGLLVFVCGWVVGLFALPMLEGPDRPSAWKMFVTRGGSIRDRSRPGKIIVLISWGLELIGFSLIAYSFVG
jgi:hypothetical protein